MSAESPTTLPACPHCGDQVRSSGYFEIYHVDDGTPMCASQNAAKKRRREKIRELGRSIKLRDGIVTLGRDPDA